ncbi:NADH-quinone oxidoreductase subunit NuoI [Rhodopseudomonas palustris]|uniref:NADH-quinone oxidoreductase subunit NuoI n=1 Tax=Rhodopseudomonas palustris TaxID=1076 RepID=UPI0021F25351|nr:NADH-quinone oxidoreductase subunit NuoI [Rhodopseudomonas palustris]UYO43878.1 NADH-quinone oxidoreductase subunit NuoI [Rhodopseudomonas palustris]UYO48513.1 NADH-quinone oxidoreductase subunit NuoI [Rhodopseudomonas palustris]UYO53249.1 NADH-quinone oxidoreductase subunit NuoI [Rhodopseudomonas palustris]
MIGFGWLEALLRVGRKLFVKPETQLYPEVKPKLYPRARGRIVLTRDPDGQERCVACNLCATVCPVGCIDLSKAVADDGRWYPEHFRVNFARCIFCGFCEDACPTAAIQLTPDYELSEWRRDALVYEKHDLLISGEGKVRGYRYWSVAGKAIPGKDKGEAEHEAPPVNLKGLLP